MADITVRRADSPADRAACYAIRAAVFAEEQGVQGAEKGDRDDLTAIHALGLVDEIPAGTGRMHLVRTRSGSEGQIAWVSVLPRFRRMGVATGIMRHLMDAARDLGLPIVTLSAQTYAKGLYESFGFQPMSTPFHMANIEHMMMIAYLGEQPSAR